MPGPSTISPLSFPLYHCPHLTAPIPHPLSYPSAAYALHPLPSLFFCDLCDAIRCDTCASVEVASYYCPNCLFEVPGASVRAERNRCARNCFLCPCCTNTLTLQGSDNPEAVDRPKSGTASQGKEPYTLFCLSCKWNSKEVGLEFEKPTNIAHQIDRITTPSLSLSTFDSLQTHLETHLRSLPSSSAPKKTASSTKKPSRYIHSITSLLPNPSLPAPTFHRPPELTPEGYEGDKGFVQGSVWFGRERDRMGFREPRWLPGPGTGELEAFEVPAGARFGGGRTEAESVEAMRNGEDPSTGGKDQQFETSWTPTSPPSLQPLRVPLRAKLIRRCLSCSHTLVRPDPKSGSTRFKTRLHASSYLVSVEVGNRKKLRLSGGKAEGGERRVSGGGEKRSTLGVVGEGERERDLKRQSMLSVRGLEEAEELDVPLVPGGSYSFQLAFLNPLTEPITLSLTPHTLPSSLGILNLPDREFAIGMAEDWDEEDQDLLGRAGAKRRPAVIRGVGGGGLERKGNVTKVGVGVLVAEGAEGKLGFDLSVAFTYKAEEEVGEKGQEKLEEVMKTFLFTVRVELGVVVGL